MKSLYSQLLAASNNSYDAKRVSAYIKTLRSAAGNNYNRAAKELIQQKLFLAMSKIVIKAINNFNSLVKTVPPHKLLHTADDIAGECYIALDTCVRNVKPESAGNFFFYYNSCLNRAIYRLYERNYQKHFGVIDNTPENEFMVLNRGYHAAVDTLEVDLASLTAEEYSVVMFKATGERLTKYLKEQGLTSKEYTALFESAKAKIIAIYHLQAPPNDPSDDE